MNTTTPGDVSTARPIGDTPPSAQSRTNSCVDTIDISEELQKLAQAHPLPHVFWRHAVRRIASQRYVAGFGSHGQFDAHSLADFACIESITDQYKIELKAILHESLIETECQESVTLRTDLQLGQNSLAIIGIPQRLKLNGFQINFVVGFAVSATSQSELLLRIERIRFLLTQAALHIPSNDSQSTTVSTIDPELDRVSRIANFKDTREFSYSLVANLSKRFGCSQASLGLKKKHHIQVLAVTGMDNFKPSSPGIIDIQQAMEESLDQAAPVVGDQENVARIAKHLPIHQHWAAKTRSSVVSIPLMQGEQCIAVATLQRDAQRPFLDADITALQELLKPFAPAVEMAIRADRGLREHLSAGLANLRTQIITPKTKLGLAVRFLAALAILVFFFGWMPYKPATSCVTMPAGMTQMMAADSMILAESFVRAGDQVNAGQLLARFDTESLETQRAELIASRNQAEIDVRRALTLGSVAEASLAKANSRSLQCQIQAIEAKMSQCHIVAPVDGMVVEADLSQKVGQVFAQGDLILSFAPLDQWELQLHIPERLSRFIEADQKGFFSPIANPGQQYEFAIETVSGAAIVVDGKNVVTATARVVGAPPTLRHGLKGIAKTHTGWKPICWVALHSAYEYACSWLWV